MAERVGDVVIAARDMVTCLATQETQISLCHPRGGLVAGTHIWTMDGTLPVEFLSPGDRVITRGAGPVALTSVSMRTGVLAPVCFDVGVLGTHTPERPVLVAPDQKVLLRDWRAKALFGTPTALVDAARLIDGEFVTQGVARDVQMIELAFAASQVIYADGLEVAVEPPVPAVSASI